MFEPPSARDILPDVAEAVEYFGLARSQAIFPLAAKISEQWNNNPDLAVAPESEWLTEAGAKVGRKALVATIQRAIARWYLARDYQQCRRELAAKFPFAAVEIRLNPTLPSCDAVRQLATKRFTVAQTLPPLPLADCAQPVCGCYYRRLLERELR